MTIGREIGEEESFPQFFGINPMSKYRKKCLFTNNSRYHQLFFPTARRLTVGAGGGGNGGDGTGGGGTGGRGGTGG